MSSKHLAKFIKQKRKKAKLSQTDVARFLGYRSGQFVSNWERDVQRPPNEILPKLVTLFRLSPEETKELLTILVSDSEEYYSNLLSNKRRSSSRS